MLITICKYLTGWFIPHYTERAISEKSHNEADKYEKSERLNSQNVNELSSMGDVSSV